MSWSCTGTESEAGGAPPPTTGAAGATGATGDCDATQHSRPQGVQFKIYLRDIHEPMVAAWEDKQAFGTDSFKDLVEVSKMYLSDP